MPLWRGTCGEHSNACMLKSLGAAPWRRKAGSTAAQPPASARRVEKPPSWPQGCAIAAQRHHIQLGRRATLQQSATCRSAAACGCGRLRAQARRPPGAQQPEPCLQRRHQLSFDASCCGVAPAPAAGPCADLRSGAAAVATAAWRLRAPSGVDLPQASFTTRARRASHRRRRRYGGVSTAAAAARPRPG